jgi:hypothetical protein
VPIKHGQISIAVWVGIRGGFRSNKGMAKRDNHYEAAFENWLRWIRVPYVAVDEAHRSVMPRMSLPERTIKSLDFIVSPPASPGAWLVDVKGRQFPTAGRQYWRNWSTADELEGLASWESLFPGTSTGLLVFAYNVVGDRAPLPSEELFVYRDRLYGFVGIRLDHYASFATPLSARWGTVSVPIAKFRALARPVREFFGVALRRATGAA